MEQAVAAQKAARLARQAALPATPTAMKAELERVSAATTRTLAEDRVEAVQRIEKAIADRRAELRRTKAARETHEATMAKIREEGLVELARHICIPQGDAATLAAELLNRAATGGSTEWHEEIRHAHAILEIGGFRSLAGWVSLQLSSVKPLWS